MLSSNTVSIQPSIEYPQKAILNKKYLMKVDLTLLSDWPYEEEEYTIYLMVASEPFFSCQAQNEPLVILNRFGGTYQPAQFILTAKQTTEQAIVRVTLINAYGVPLRTCVIDDIHIASE